MTIRFRRSLIAVGVVTLIGLFFSTNLYLGYNYVQKVPLSWFRAIRSGLITWYLWGLLAIPVLELARRIPLTRLTWLRDSLLHLGAATLVSAIHLIAMSTWVWRIEGKDHSLEAWWRNQQMFALMSFHWDVLTYAGILAFALAWNLHQQSRDRELRTTRLETQLVQTRLRVLESRLHPHFLFNTLNSIAALIQDDPQAAERVVMRLSELLRTVLSRELGRQATLDEELTFARQYLEIEQVRFADRLSVRWNVTDDARLALVPSLLLQPLVENAVRHGVARTTGKGEITINANRRSGQLLIVIENTAESEEMVSPSNGTGEGLRNTRQRLAQQFGDRYTFELETTRNGHGCVRLVIPYSTDCPGGNYAND